ncbi:MAG: phosphoribosylformylglycinamidine synthase [Desulfobacterales bacterium]|nr:phosphoribosylformylglycinamidine synthase [Desulfobacterales bacterium]
MKSRLEITLKDNLLDAEGLKLQKNAEKYFGIELESVRSVHILTFDSSLTEEQLETVRADAFTNPVIQISSFAPLDVDFDYCLWIGFRPGVKDNAGSTALEAIEDILSIKLPVGDAVYTSKRYCIKSKDLSYEDADKLSGELLANDIIQQWKIFKKDEWDKNEGVGIIVPKVELNHTPTVETVTVESNEALLEISDERNLALNPNDIPTIREYFLGSDVRKDREEVGLSDPTDLELEYISQARSDHCNHNTFQGIFRYKDMETGEIIVEDNPFKTYIKEPTLKLKEMKDWVVSVLWDNAGVGKFDEEFNYTITGETHNSPSNMEAYGGAITGIVGVYRDPLGTGLASKLIMGSYGFCVGDFDYDGELKPKLHPRRLLDGVIEGVKDGGNKSGVPTTFGQVLFNQGYLGKSLVFVTALGLMPAKVEGKLTHEKTTTAGDLIIMSGGRVGKDGIHGVTASSEVFSENTPAGHVQIGDPYTQKKMHDFILEVRDESLMTFITDNGGGGLSSSIGESAELSNGCIVDLDKVPLKYEGLDQWEIWISESQERMTIAVKPEDLDRFMELSRKHAVESTVIGEYTNSGKLHIKYNGKTCAYVNIDLLASAFPQWEFDAEWTSPEMRGLREPVINPPKDYNELLKDLLSRPNICSKEWVTRQYDHEVQGTSVIKPLVGKGRDVNNDASVIRPVLTSEKGLAFTQSLLPMYSKIDAYHMTTCTIDEAVRRMICVGANLDHISGVDNFCWPDIGYNEDKNPDGKFKAAQLIRSCRALKDMCEAYEMPLLSGKDSMYVDGHLNGPYGETRKVSALETMQFSTTGVVPDISKCVTMEAKSAGDSVYLLGDTKNELGASEYYERLGFTGLNVPVVTPEKYAIIYKALSSSIEKELIASAHGVYRGGLGTHLSMVAMGGALGLDIDLAKVPVADKIDREDTILFSESAGRFIVTVSEENKEVFEKIFKGLPCECIGSVTDKNTLSIKGFDKEIVSVSVNELLSAWKAPFGEMI